MHIRSQPFFTANDLQDQITRHCWKELPTPKHEYVAYIHLHEAFTLEFLHLVSGTVQPLPLWVQHWVSHLPPCFAVQQKSQAHHACHGNQHSIYRLVAAVYLEDSQQSHARDQASQDEKEDHKGWDAACLLPFLFAWCLLEKTAWMSGDILNCIWKKRHFHVSDGKQNDLYLECPLS